MVLTLYMLPKAPPVRAVLMAAEALGLDLKLQIVDLHKGEQFSDEFKKINPQHTVPTLDDDGIIIWESHAINAYLVKKYGKDDSLYPEDPVCRALVDQRLHFDTGVLFRDLQRIVKFLCEGSKSISEDDLSMIHKSLNFLNIFLENRKWVAGDDITIADFSLVATTTSIGTFILIEENVYPNITRWLKRCEELPFYEVNKPGLEEFYHFIVKIYVKER